MRGTVVVPLFKLYVINNVEAFFGYCPIQEHTVKLDGEPTPMWDLMGKDAILFHHSAYTDPATVASQNVHQSLMWFDSIWNTVAREPHPVGLRRPRLRGLRWHRRRNRGPATGRHRPEPTAYTSTPGRTRPTTRLPSSVPQQRTARTRATRARPLTDPAES